MRQSYNQILKESMDFTLERISPGDSDYPRMESMAMTLIHDRISARNAARARGEPWMRAPSRLEPSQIAAILEKAMRGRLRSVGQSTGKRGALEVLSPDGTAWSRDTDEICRACMALDYRITRGGMAAAMDRLLFLVPRAEDMAG